MIDRLIHGLAAGTELDAEGIMDVLWLAAVGPAGQAEPVDPDATAPYPADIASRSGEPTADWDVSPLRPESRPESRPEAVGEAVPTTAIGLDAPRPLRRVATLPMAVRRLRKVVAPGPRFVVDIDATVDATAEAAGRLTPMLTRPPQRALDLALVIDGSRSMRIWDDIFEDLERLLAQTSSFRSVSRWHLDVGEGAIRPHAQHLEEDQAGAPLQRPERLVDPSGRRLVLIATDARDRAWYGEAPWKAIGTWCAAMPTVLVQVLPQQYWTDTAVGDPYMTSRALTPAAPNRQYQRRLAWWTAAADPGGLPLPVVTLTEKSLDAWAQSIVNGTAWASGITTTAPDAGSVFPVGDDLDADVVVNDFLAKATPGAQRLARILASADAPLSMPLISVLRERLAPETGVAELAEILACDLLEEAASANGAGQSLLRYRDGTREILRLGTSALENWDAFAAVGEYLEERYQVAGPLRIMVPGAAGSAELDTADQPFHDFQRALAVRLGLRPRVPDTIEDDIGALVPAGAREEHSREGQQESRPAETAVDELIGGSGELRGALDDLIAGLGEGDEVKVATFEDDGIAVWDVTRDENGTPQGRRTVLTSTFVADPEAFYAERLAPSLSHSPLLITRGAADPSHAAVFRLLRAAHRAQAFDCQGPFGGVLREAIRSSRLIQGYDLVVINEEPGGKLRVGRQSLFQPGAVGGDRTGRFHVRCAAGGNRGTVFAVVARGPRAEPFAANWLHPVQVQSALVPPGTYQVEVLLSRPGRVRFDGLPAGLSAEPRPLAELIRQVPDRLRSLPPTHLVCLIEVSGGDRRLRHRIGRLEQLIAAAGTGTREVSVSVISYGPHTVERGVPDEAATLLARAVPGERAIRVLRGLVGRQSPAREYQRAAQTECALDELSRLLSARSGRDGRPVVVTAGKRPPHPARVNIQSEIIPCPRRVDWRAMMTQLRSVPAISFGALCDPDAIGAIWRDLGRNAIGSVDRVDILSFARKLGLVSRTHAVPFPLLEAETAAAAGLGARRPAGRDDPAQRGGIAVLGPPGSGKTTFLGALSAALQVRREEQQGGMLAGRHDDPMRLSIEMTGAPLTRTGLQFGLTRPESPGAEIARKDRFGEVARRSTEISLNLVDPAGDLWSDGPSRDPGLRHRQEMIRDIAGTDGILYLFDPIREFETGDALPSINRFLAQVTQEVARNSQRDFDGTLPHHLAVCVTKFDDPRVLATARRTGRVIMDPDDAHGFPRVRDRDAQQVFARLCNGNGQALVDVLSGAFHRDRVRYFVTSAIGFQASSELGRGAANPVNVVEPVLWLAEQIVGS